MVQQLPPNFLVWKTMEISMCYGEWIKLPKLTLIPGTRRLSRLYLNKEFFFFFVGYIWAGKILNFPAKRFRDASVAQGGFDHLMHRFQWSRFGHVSDS
jgi:hypothetical protein